LALPLVLVASNSYAAVGFGFALAYLVNLVRK